MQNEDLIQILENNYTQAFDYRERRHSEWNENYTLYRGKIIINRLTQRQNVCIPLMKETVRTWLSDIDDAPSIEFEVISDARTPEEIGKKEEKEICLKEYWLDFFRKQKIELKDIVDKKQVGLYGRSFKKINVANGRPTIEIIDPQHILIDRYVDSTDIDTAQFIYHIGIYRTLKDLEANENYNQEAVKELKEFYATEQGIIKAAENYQAAIDQIDKMEKMGVPDMDSPILGETYVELNECYQKLWDKDEQKIHLVVKVDDKILMNKPLNEIIGETEDDYWANHYPFSTWADDVEKTDIWSDSLADIIRPINKVLNSWFSQLVENRTLRNFGMNYYDATNPRFIPQTFEPVPWGWYPVPGDPNRIIKRVDIPELTEGIDEMMYLTQIAERASAVTSIKKGATERRQVTLGEVQLAMGQAQERIAATAKFYSESWNDFVYRWYKFIEAQADNLEIVKIAKKSWKAGKMYSRDIKPKDWLSKGGYRIRVVSSAEQEAKTFENVQKFTAIVGQIPNNIPLQEIYQKKLLDMLNLNPEEIEKVLNFEKQKMMALAEPVAEPVVPSPVALPSKTIPVPIGEELAIR